MRNLLFVLLMLILYPVAEGSELQWFYVDLYTGSQITLTEDAVLAHERAPAKICAKTEPFICFNSDVFRFAVPRELGNQQTWDYDGIKYQLVSHEVMMLLGRPVQVFVIDQDWKTGPRLRFFFSPAFGLFAFTALPENQSSPAYRRPLFLAENGCAFGAAPSCVEQKGRPEE
jgi:hypothetical protein